MTDKTNPRVELDAALEAMRDTGSSRAENADRITLAAVVACAEALSLLVDAHLAAVKPKRKPEPDPRESLPDDTPVGHGWVMARGEGVLLKLEGNGLFTWWHRGARKWGSPGIWCESDMPHARPATVGDLRRVGLPVTEWPDITAPEPEPPRAEKAIAERDNAVAALRFIRRALAALAAGYVHEDDDARSAYRQSLVVVEGQARRRGIDLGEEVS